MLLWEEPEDAGLIPRSGRSPRGGNGNPLQDSCLGNPMDRGARWAPTHGGHREPDTTERLSVSTVLLTGLREVLPRESPRRDPRAGETGRQSWLPLPLCLEQLLWKEQHLLCESSTSWAHLPDRSSHQEDLSSLTLLTRSSSHPFFLFPPVLG